jgi:hypothetical protein
MTPLFKKLNLNDQDKILVLNPPEFFDKELSTLKGVKILRRASATTSVAFSIGFATTCTERDEVSAKLARSAEGDATVWIAYPKGTSKRYRCEFNRDSEWSVLGAAGFEPVRQVAFDEDWSALRFRRSQHIKSMTRQPSMAISKEGKRRTTKRARG